MASLSLDEEFRLIAEDFQQKAKLTPQQLKAFKVTKVEDIRVVLANVQKRNDDDRACIWLRRIEPFINTFLDFGNIIEVFLNASDFLAFIWGPIKWLLWITRNHFNALNSLLSIYQDLEKQITFLQAVKAQVETPSSVRQILIWIYKDILAFHVKAMEFFNKSRWRQFLESNWKGFTDEISHIKENLSQNRRLFDSHLSVTMLEEIRLLRQKFERDLQDSLAKQAFERTTAVVNWLSPSHQEVSREHQRHTASRERNPGSCKWILKESAFQHWFDLIFCPTPMLWISGKSVLASYIIEQLQAYQDVSVVYFYFGHQDPRRDNFFSMATTLVAQMMQHKALVDYLYTSMTKSINGLLPNKAEAASLLDFALALRKTFVVLDGLDECSRDERQQICGWFRSAIMNLDRKHQDEIRCLFICQEDGFAKKDLRDIAHLRITADHNRADIHGFAKAAQQRIEDRLGPCPLGIHNTSISDVVTERSNAMFIYADLVLQELESYPNKDLLEKEWDPESFPAGISELYDRILQRLEHQSFPAQRCFRNQILSLICLARRPLRWFEVQAAVSLSLERNSINSDSRRTPDTCEEICASFVQVHMDQTVELVHSTARDFLIQRKVVLPSRAEVELCHMSISYLCFDDFSPSRTDAQIHNTLVQGRYGFFEYAVTFWAFHLISAAKESPETISSLKDPLRTFLANHDRQIPTKARIPLKLQALLEPFSNTPYHIGMIHTVIWARKQLLINHSADLDKERLDLAATTRRIRSVLQQMLKSDITLAERQALEQYYGKSLFKCPKSFCQFFSKGFNTEADLEKHIDRHDRPYLCGVEGCYVSVLGCIDQKSLDSHIRQSHGFLKDSEDCPQVADLAPDGDSESPSPSPAPEPEPEPQPEDEPEVNHLPPVPQQQPSVTRESGRRGKRSRREPITRPARVVKHPRKFQCPDCSSSFTRATNLRAHRRAHANERPFFCTVCNECFVRQNDKKRHERIHSVPMYICGGQLEDGRTWGCGQRFGRKDAMEAHFRTEIGERCREPLLATAAQPFE